MSRAIAINGQGGVNLLGDPTAIGDNELVMAKNLYPHTPGTFGTRKAMDFFQVWGVDGTLNPIYPQWYTFFNNDVAGFKAFALSSIPGLDWVSVLNVNHQGAYRDEIWVNGSGVTANTMRHGRGITQRASTPYCIVAVGKRILVLDGTTSGWVICQRQDADATVAMVGGVAPDSIIIQQFVLKGGVQPETITPLFGVVRGNRLILGSPVTGFDSTIIWCDIMDQGGPDSWRTIGDNAVRGRGFNIGSDFEGGLTAMFSASNVPAAASPQTAVYLFKKEALYMFLGEPGQSVDLTPSTINGTAQIVRLNINAGCVAPNTLQWTPQGLMWLGTDDVWIMNEGSLPSRCGTKIRPMLAAQPAALQHRLHAAYHDGAYKLALYSDGQGPTDNSACHEQWWLDLRDGTAPDVASAKWWGPQVYTPSQAVDAGSYALVADTRVNADRVLISPQIAVCTGWDGTTFVDSAQILVLVTFERINNKDRILPPGEWANWQASTAYLEGELLRPQGAGSTEWVCSTAGTSGFTQPIWYAAFGSSMTVADGSVVWTPRAYEPDPGGGSVGTVQTYLCPSQDHGDVLFDFISKEYMDPQPALDKLLDGMDVTYVASQPLGATMSLLPDFESDDVHKGMLVPTTRLDVTQLDMQPIRRWDSQFLNPNPSKRSRGKSFQVRLAQSGKFFIPNEFATLAIGIGNSTLVGTSPFNFISTDGGYSGTPDAPSIEVDSVSAAIEAMWGAVRNQVIVFDGSFSASVQPLDSTSPNYDLGSAGLTVTTNGNPSVGYIYLPWAVVNPLRPDDVTARQTASQRYWINLFGMAGLVGTLLTDALLFSYGFPVTSVAATPCSIPGVVTFKEFRPRVRVFKRSPT